MTELPAELSEQAYMWQWEQGVDGGWGQEWLCWRNVVVVHLKDNIIGIFL